MTKPGQHVLSTLRQMIVAGEIRGGEKLAEIPTAERLGVSRTPVRIAFRSLEQEGLLEKQPRRGYRVRQISEEDICGAVEVRGVLEGLAARQAAEKGLSKAQREGLLRCLESGDALFDRGYLMESDLEIYHELNRSFHMLIVEASQNPAIASALSRNEHLPFASVNALAVDFQNLDKEYKRLNFAHMQHHAAYDAIDRGQGARAEAIMREHANATLRYAEIFSHAQGPDSDLRVIGGDPKGD